jgi:hypothetical protein
MTKYILHGGNTGKRNRDNNRFFTEMTSGLNGRVKILLNYFSRDENEAETLAKQDIKRLLKYSKNKNLEFQVAELGKFESQLKWADVMYMRGGITYKLLKKLRKVKNIRLFSKLKVIAGSSAGAYAISKYYFSNNVKVLGRGLGLLEIKCYCHCKSKDTKIIRNLLEHREMLPLILLPDYKMQIIYE